MPDFHGFEPEFTRFLTHIFEKSVTFNEFIGLKIDEIGPPNTRCHFVARPELIGNFSKKILHGGVIAAALDSVGGLGVLAQVARNRMDLPWQQRLEMFSKMGTIDLRVDYLEGAAGHRFDLTCEVLRVGSRVASVRMDCFDEDAKRIASASAAFFVPPGARAPKAEHPKS